MLRFDRYLLKEMFVPAVVGALLVLLMLVGNVLYMLLYQMYEFRASWSEVGTLLLYQIPGLTMQAIPAAMLLGTALALNRLVREREMLAIRMTGTRLLRIILPYLLVGVVFSGILFALQEYVIPKTSKRASKLYAQIQMRQPINAIQRDAVFRVDDKFLYVPEVDTKNQVLRNVYMVKRNFQGSVVLMTVPVARYRDGVWVALPDQATGEPPRAWAFNAKGEMQAIIETPDEALVNLRKEAYNFLFDPPAKPEELTIKELLSLRQGVRGTMLGMGSRVVLEPRQLTFYLHRKFAAPLAALIAVLIAVPLSVRFGRSGLVGLLLSAGVAFIFVVMSQWAQVLAVKSEPLLNPLVAAWGPGAFFAAIGLVLLFTDD